MRRQVLVRHVLLAAVVCGLVLGVATPKAEAVFSTVKEIGENLWQNRANAIQTLRQLRVAEQNLRRYRTLLRDLKSARDEVKAGFLLGALTYKNPTAAQNLELFWRAAHVPVELPYDALSRIRATMVTQSTVGSLKALYALGKREEANQEDEDAIREEMDGEGTEGANGLLTAGNKIAFLNSAKLGDIDTSTKAMAGLLALYVHMESSRRSGANEKTRLWMTEGLALEGDDRPEGPWEGPIVEFTFNGEVRQR